MPARAGYCVGLFQKRIYKMSSIMSRNETGLIAIQTCMRGLWICTINNTRIGTLGFTIIEYEYSISSVAKYSPLN